MDKKNDLKVKSSKRNKPKLEALELSMFCHQFSLVLRSGISPVEGIPLIAEEIVNPLLKNALNEISDDITIGYPLYDSIKKQVIFPDYLVAMTRLGETTGSLDSVMENLSDYYDNEDRLRKKIRSAVTYPIILVVLMTAIIVLLIVRILPMFAQILDSLGGELPAATKLLLAIGLFFQGAFVWIVVAIVLIVGVCFAYSRSEKGKSFFDILKAQIPYFGRLYKKIAAARFAHGMALVLKSGMGFEEGLDIVVGIIGNRYIRDCILKIGVSLREGAALEDALLVAGLFPTLFVRMIKIGHKTGDLDSTMNKISKIYDSDVENSLNNIANTIEPALVIILSAIVAVILLAVMLPLINIMGTIG